MNADALMIEFECIADACMADAVDEYFASLPHAQREALTGMRETIRGAVPELEDAFSYAMPAVKLNGQPLVWYAAWKRHYSLYPIGAAILEAHRSLVDGYETARGTIRFPASAPLPNDLIATLVRARAVELAERGK